VPNPILSIKNIEKCYVDRLKTVKALNGVSIDIFPGEVFALLGSNGAGKTTLSTILATLHPPTSGDILFNGVSIYKDLDCYRRALGYCPQRPNLDNELSVEDNLIFAGRYYLLDEYDLKERVTQLLEQFELTRFSQFLVKALSGGYRQRLLIARSLIHSPSVLVLDEPTVALDSNIRRQLWRSIRDLKDQGVTVILTTHYLEEAEALADRVCILERGNVVLTGDTQGLMRQFEKNNLEEVFLHLTQEESAK
jgi:ABC-2 type transport system ATP-binding protein